MSKAASLWATLREALTGSEQDFTEGPIGRAVLMLSIPMVAETLLESVFAVVDVFVVSRLGADAVATVGLTESILALLYAVAMGLSMATTAMVARRTGEKDPEGAARAAVQAIALGVGVSTVLGVVCGIFAPDMIRLLGASDEVVRIGSNYARIMLGGNITVLLLWLINAIFRGVGDATIAMRVLWLGNALNIVLAPCLVFGLGPFPALGVTGAAVATNLGRGTAVAYQVWKLVRHTPRLNIRREHVRLHPPTLVALARVAMSGSVQMLIATASWGGLVRILAGFGSAAVAGYTIGMRVIMFALMPSMGMANAAATLVGQSLGANKPERAERSVWIVAGYNAVFLGTVSVIFIAIPGAIVGLFTTDPAVLAYATSTLRVVSYGFLFYAAGMVLEQSFNGAGDTWTPTVLNFICFWLFEIPLAWALAHPLGLGPTGVFIAVTAGFSLLAVVSLFVFRRGRWKTKRI